MKKVPLVYEQGLSYTTAKSRWRGFVLGDVATGHAVTRALHESALSVRLRPPAKWSYGTVILRSALLSFVLLIAYIHMASSTQASSAGVVAYVVVVVVILLVCRFMVWRHNSFFYPRELERWTRSLLCRRCGAVCEHAGGLGV